MWNNLKDKEFTANLGIYEVETIDWCTLKIKFKGESDYDVTSRDGFKLKPDPKDLYKIDDDGTGQQCEYDAAKTKVNIQMSKVRPIIHFMRDFETGDSKDIALKIATNYTLLYQLQMLDQNIKGQIQVYLDDPENPILSGAVKALAASATAFGCVYLSLF